MLSNVRFSLSLCILTRILLAGANLAASAGMEDGVGAGGDGALGLDVLAPHPTHDPPLLVDLQRK